MVFSNNLLMGAAAAAASGGDTVYVPKGAIWTNGTDEYLHFTPGSTGNNKKFTISTWLKQVEIAPGSGNHPGLFGAWDDSTNRGQFYFDDGGYITFFNDVSGSRHTNISTASTYRQERDPTGWLHLFLRVDSTVANPGPANIYMAINGEVITPLNSPSYPSQNSTYQWCTSGVKMTVGAGGIGGSYEMYGAYYLSDTILLDGYAGSPSDFARYDSNGVWVPKDPTTIVTDNKGTNGFWLDYADSSDLGNDVSGNNNDFTLNNIGSANATADRPANSSTTGNFCTLNPVASSTRKGGLSNGNLKASGNGKDNFSTMAIPLTGKWYFEATLTTAGATYDAVGVAEALADQMSEYGSKVVALYGSNGEKFLGSSWASYGTSYTSGDVIGVYVDDGQVTFYKNNTSQGTCGSAFTTQCFATTQNTNASTVWDINFGQTSFTYTPPTDAKSLNSANLDEPAVTKPSDNFSPILFEGNGRGQRVGNFIPFTDSHTVNYSARFDAGDSDYLTRTPSSSGNRRTWTFSAWVKRGQINTLSGVHLFGADRTGGYGDRITFGNGDTDDRFNVNFNDAGDGRLQTYRYFQDTSVWTHFVVAVDTTQSTDTDRVKIYINGVLQTSNLLATANYPTQNYDTMMNYTTAQMVGARGGSASQFMDGYMAEVVMIDGTQLDASSFGQTDTSTNRWIPKDVSGLTFGTNGFYLPFPQKTAYGLDTSQGASAALDAQTLFLANFDGSDAATSATDASNFSHTITFAGNAQLDTAIKKFGTAALLLDGSGDYVSMASFPPLAGSSFCIEGWAYLTDGSGTQLAFIGNRDGGADDDSWLINIGGTAKRMSVRTDNTEVMSSDTDITLNTWTHIAYTWDGTTNRLFQAGALVASSTSFTPAYSDVNTLYIGHDGRGTTNDWPGSIDEVRVVKGSAVYTSTFTPPTSAYSAPAAGNMFVPFNLDQINGSNQMYDTPTRNFANIAPVPWQFNAPTSLTTGNLNTSFSTSTNIQATQSWSTSANFYFEIIWTRGDTVRIGIFPVDDMSNSYGLYLTWSASGVSVYSNNVEQASSLFTAADSEVIGVHVNGNNVQFYQEGVARGTTYPITPGPVNSSQQYTVIIGGSGGTNTFSCNFGQWIYWDSTTLTLDNDAEGYFRYSPPTDAKAINQDNRDSNTAGITGFAWFKERDGTTNHLVWDRVNGIYKYLLANTSDVQGTDTNGLKSFLQYGAEVGNMSSLNDDGDSMVLWQWAANGTGTTNSDGSGADVTVSANATAGFSVVKYVGDDTSGRTIGTGLTAQPAFILIKNMDNSGYDWQVYHKSLGNTASLSLNVTDGPSTSSTYWNNTSPATSNPFVFSLGNSVATNKASDDFIAYVWAEIEGYSKFGKYIGNNNTDGAFVYLGFQPAWVMIKRNESGYAWHIHNSAMSPYNPVGEGLNANDTGAQLTLTCCDFTATGLKIRTTNGGYNASGATYLYAAFAENPFGGSGVAQAKAR